MDRIYNIEDAKKKITEDIKYYDYLIKAWEKVKRVRTKSGGDFKNLSKNFDGAEVIWQYSCKYLVMPYTDERGSYTTDKIYLSKNVYTHTEELTTAGELENAIKEHITKYKALKEEKETALNKIETQLKAIQPELEKLKEAIKEAAKTNNNYIMGAYIKEYLKIL
jgi:hypothetical protein